MRRDRRFVVLLVVASALAGVLVWLTSRPSQPLDAVEPQETPAPSTEVVPSSSPPQPVRPSRHPVAVDPEAPSGPADEQTSPKRDPHDWERAVAHLVDPEASRRLGADVLFVLHEKFGIDEVRRALEGVASLLAEREDRRRGAWLLALAHTEFLAGASAAAGDRLVEAVLAMDPDWAWNRHGLPRLVYFAAGPNVHPWSESERSRFRELPAANEDAFWGFSGAGGWDGGSYVAEWVARGRVSRWTGHEFFDAVEQIAGDDARPEPAMAATIRVHAVTSRHNWQHLPHDLPESAVFRAVEAEPTRLTATMEDREWRAVFEQRRQTALEAGVPWAVALEEVFRRFQRVRDAMPQGDYLPQRAEPLVIWSLSDAFARRFAKAEGPRADALRALTAKLVAFDDARSPAPSAPK